MAIITNTNLDQAQLQLFENNFERTVNQKESKLANSPAIKYMDIKGISNIARIDGDELTKVSGRNPDKVFSEFRVDNRKSITERYTKTYILDHMDKVINLIADPTADLYANLKEAKARAFDRLVCYTAGAPVIIGAPDEAGTTVSAEDDGVITLDATNGFTYKGVISPAITNFANNYIDCSSGVTLVTSANEEEMLRNDDYYMNAFYSSANTVDKGKITNASGFNVVTFAGTVNGGVEIENPILEEKEGKRTNLLLAPNSIGFAMEIGDLSINKIDSKVNSYGITIDLYFKAVRLHGQKVQKITSTI